jgi:hypothetical protein
LISGSVIPGSSVSVSASGSGDSLGSGSGEGVGVGVTVTGGVTTLGGVTGAATGALAVVKEVVAAVLSPISFLARTLTLYLVPSSKFPTLQERAVVPAQTTVPFTSTS